MEERYSRNLGSITLPEQEQLKNKKVFIAGAGGLGCYISELLVRTGVGEIRIADGDTFSLSNLNRQLYADMNTIGRSKAAVVAERAAVINPAVRFKAYSCFIDADNVNGFISGCDLVMDALDSVPARLLLEKACEATGIPLVHGAVSGWTAQAGISLPGDRLISKIYSAAGMPAAEPVSVMPFVPSLCASFQTALAVSFLCGRDVPAGTAVCADLSDFSFLSW